MNLSKRFLKPWRANEMKSCPQCYSEVGLREISYGLPDGPLDENKYAIGGCCISDNDPTVKCIECGWEGENVNNAGIDNKIKMVKLQDISKMSDSEIDSYAKKIWEKLAKPKKGSGDDNSKK
jgi:hypothetical protein